MINAGDTAFVLMSTAFVMLMTPGLAFFYGGMVRKKNVLSVLMQCFVVLCLLSIHWMLFGYSLAFAPGNGFWGVLVKGESFEGWVPMAQITKVIEPGDYVLDNAINVLGGDIEEG